MKKDADLSPDTCFILEGGKEFWIGAFLEKLSNTELILLYDQLLRTMKSRKLEIPPRPKRIKAKRELKSKKLPGSERAKVKSRKKAERKEHIRWVRKLYL